MASNSRGAYTQQPQIHDDDDLIDPDDADLNDFDDPLQQASSNSTSTRHYPPPPTGTIGSSSTSSSTRPLDQNYLTSRIGGEDRRADASTSTIDESVWHTLRRDLLAVWSKMREVLYPRYLFGGTMFDSDHGLRGVYANLRAGGLQGGREALGGLAGRVLDAETLLSGVASGDVEASGGGGQGQSGMSPGLRDWDLWGPLVFCLLLSLLLSYTAKESQKEDVFSGVFAMVWIGEAVVTLQIKLLGGNISFAQSICIIGYTLFPLVIAALLSALRLYWIARIPVYLFLISWSLAAGVSIMTGSGVVKNRVGIAVYPLFVFYVGIGCLCFIS